MARSNYNRDEELARIRADLRYYRDLLREYASMPKDVATGTNGSNQHAVRQHALADIQAIIKDLERELTSLMPPSRNLRSMPSRGEIL
ncbi:hypothetical protein PVA44_07540 (plasmid) [Entomospira nematocerorum]|uniref:Uncharacterized protein n=1 Tax=Entomospira nematocerorum TaxID=2719987 RepID=A0A968KUY1_9SPIO|nr:hypothetical protein [Entomospira nematocera]NIZ47764.1 hypothetical protein [Entomospira nematocera]WDI34718.1 hypothetical protein PVA44_07540 [Entomospira nematocera]